MNNPYVGKTWVDRISEYPTRRLLTDTTDPTDTKEVYVTRQEGTVTEAGDVFDASTMNGLESRINSAFNALAPAGFTELTATLQAGSVMLIFMNAAITTTSTYDIFTDVYGVSPTAVSVTTGELTLTFEAQESDLSVKVRVY